MYKRFDHPVAGGVFKRLPRIAQTLFVVTLGMISIRSTHGAMYDPTTGGCLGGPCRGGGLVPIPVEEIDGAVVLKEQVRDHG